MNDKDKTVLITGLISILFTALVAIVIAIASWPSPHPVHVDPYDGLLRLIERRDQLFKESWDRVDKYHDAQVRKDAFDSLLALKRLQMDELQNLLPVLQKPDGNISLSKRDIERRMSELQSQLDLMGE
mgnify:CR=1 FL=1